MSVDQAAVLTVLSLGIAGLWAIYSLLSARIAEINKDLTVIRDNYVRRDDFLRVIDRFETKLDNHLKMLVKRE